MKKILIKSGVFVLTFFITTMILVNVMNRNNNDMTMAMGRATLPVVTFQQGGLRVNELHGHTVKMDVSTMAATTLELGEKRELAFQIEKYGAVINDVVLEVRSCDGDRLIQQIACEDYEETEDRISVETALKDLLEEETEYALVAVLTDQYGREVRYYTRCTWGGGYHAGEKVAFVLDFHEKTYDKEAAKELSRYLESNSSGNNTTLHKVDIHSSLNQVTWGELAVEQLTEPVVDILELGRDTGSFALKTMVTSGEDDDTRYYRVEEYYRIRYTKDRVYLLDFERTMTQIPYVEGDIYANNKIVLGIVGTDIGLQESPDGNFVVFQTAGRLCGYQGQTGKVSVLYSFYDGENQDARTLYNGHDIKVLQIDDAGNVKFAVYGYFNRGRHEGETGVAVYAFDSGLNTTEELAWLPDDRSWQMLKKDGEKLLYLNASDMLYIYLEGVVYQVDLKQKTAEVLAEVTGGGSIQTSEDHRILLWNQEEALTVFHLEEEQQVDIPVAKGERIQALGFMGDDMIYGLIREEDIVREANGQLTEPMYRVVISNSQGQVQKTYQEEGVYTVSAQVDGNQITLNRVKERGESGYEDTVPEHIVNNAEQTAGRNKIVTAAIDVYQTVTQIQVKKDINVRGIQILTPREVIFEGSRSVSRQIPEKEKKLYYVYNRHGVEEICSDAAKAIMMAYESSGRVVDETGCTVWFKGNRVTRNQIMAITEPEQVSKADSLAVCLDTMLKFKGITADTSLQLAEGKSAQEILQAGLPGAEAVDLTGAAMDAMLYFVNKDVPVLGVLADGEAVLITGFNEFNIVVFEPSSGKLYKKGLKDSAKWFEENGNCFITYLEAE